MDEKKDYSSICNKDDLDENNKCDECCFYNEDAGCLFYDDYEELEDFDEDKDLDFDDYDELEDIDPDFNSYKLY